MVSLCCLIATWRGGAGRGSPRGRVRKPRSLGAGQHREKETGKKKAREELTFLNKNSDGQIQQNPTATCRDCSREQQF